MSCSGCWGWTTCRACVMGDPRWFAVVAVVALAGCSGGSTSYEQTWPKSYAKTTCAEWTSEMSDKQQFAAAGDMLWEHLKANGAEERPGRSSIEGFQTVLGQSCAQHETATINEIGEGIGLPD